MLVGRIISTTKTIKLHRHEARVEDFWWGRGQVLGKLLLDDFDLSLHGKVLLEAGTN